MRLSLVRVGLFALVAACGSSGGVDAGDAPDLAVPQLDLSASADLSAAVDLAAAEDLSAAADLGINADLYMCVPTSCPMPVTACQVRACQSNACTVSNTDNTTTCSDSGGTHCDGNGSCVACLVPAHCPAQTTVCKVSTCGADHACGYTKTALGTPCSEGSGVVCDGNGACVATHCMDGVQDANETDVDCGGSCGATCKDTPQQKCAHGSDCKSGVCSGVPLKCQVPTCGDLVRNGTETDTDCGGATCDGMGNTCNQNEKCLIGVDCTSGYCPSFTCQLHSDGQACTGDAQCTNGHCYGAGGGGGICCSTACNSTCNACTFALTGKPDGTCGTVQPGQPAPAGQCAVNPPCGNDGKCNGSGGCELVGAGAVCGASMTCDGAGGCN